MKNIIIISLLLLTYTTGYTQVLDYEVRGTYSRSVKKEKLNDINTLSDISPGYPTTWLTDYISTEILATCNGNVMKASGTDHVLNADQKNIIQMADLGTEIDVVVNYRYKNPVTHNTDIRKMHFSTTVIPDIEAEYPGGYLQLTQYLHENAINKIPESSAKQLQQAIVRFTVNEDGEIVNVHISQTSGDQKTDKLLLKTINKMPNWKPAENSDGVNVSQEFEFSVGSAGC